MYNGAWRAGLVCHPQGEPPAPLGCDKRKSLGLEHLAFPRGESNGAWKYFVNELGSGRVVAAPLVVASSAHPEFCVAAESGGGNKVVPSSEPRSMTLPVICELG